MKLNTKQKRSIAYNVIGLGAVAKRQPVRGAIVAKPVLYEGGISRTTL